MVQTVLYSSETSCRDIVLYCSETGCRNIVLYSSETSYRDMLGSVVALLCKLSRSPVKQAVLGLTQVQER